MKKFILLIVFILGSLSLFGQSNSFKYVLNAKGGITVGNTADTARIDSIIYSNGTLKFYRGSTEIAAVDTNHLSDRIDLKANIDDGNHTGTTVIEELSITGTISTPSKITTAILQVGTNVAAAEIVNILSDGTNIVFLNAAGDTLDFQFSTAGTTPGIARVDSTGISPGSYRSGHYLDSLANEILTLKEMVELLSDFDLTAPAFLSAELGNGLTGYADDTLLIIMDTCDIHQDSIPPISAFTLTENGIVFGLDEVLIGHDTIFVVLDSIAKYGTTYLVDYARVHPYLQDSTGNKTVAWNDKPVTNKMPTGYTAEFQAILDDLANPITGDTLTWLNTMIDSLVNVADVYDRIKLLYMPIASTTLADSYVNWAAANSISDYTLTLGEAPLLNRVAGWIFNGTTNYLKTGWIPNSDSLLTNHGGAEPSGIGINDISLFSWQLTDVNGSYDPLGTTDGGTKALQFNPRTNSNIKGRVNSGSLSDFGAVSSTLGLTSVTRRGHADLEAYFNGASEGTAIDESGYLPVNEMYVGGRNNAGSLSNGFPGTIAIIMVTDAMSDEEEALIYEIFSHIVQRLTP